MKRQQQPPTGADKHRRAFLTRAGGGMAALAGAALVPAGRAPRTEVAAGSERGPRRPAYRETPHVKAYYERARI